MAYQNVSTPRFYVNILEWLDKNDIDFLQYPEGSDYKSLFHTLPVNPQPIPSTFNFIDVSDYTPPIDGNLKFFTAFLGHDFEEPTAIELGLLNQGIINWESGYPPQYKGFSICHQTGIPTQLLTYAADLAHKVGSIAMGVIYDMPNAPNLSLTMSREYGGTKEFTTYNGSSMSNTMWSKPPKWGDLGAWELGDGNPSLTKSARRSWDLKFSYMDDGGLWGSNQSLSFDSPNTAQQNINIGYESGDMANLVANATTFKYNLLTDDNFFSQVWHKTLTGTLPFIFQPDSSNNNPDQFCIAKFKDNSLKATQSAFNVYDISISIEEVW